MSETLGDRLQDQVYHFDNLTEGSLENHCRSSQDRSILLLSVNLKIQFCTLPFSHIFFKQTMDFSMGSTQMPTSPPNQKKVSQ